jgi:hypothetical protein
LGAAGRIEEIIKIVEGKAVTAPGIPPGYPEPQKLVTEDGIQPAKG